MSGLYLLAACIVLSAAASFFLKLGSTSLDKQLDLLGLISNPMLWVGGFCYTATFIGYIYLLRVLPLSLAQPAITAGASLVTMFLAVLFLREQLTLINWSGVLLVCFGIFLLFFGRS